MQNTTAASLTRRLLAIFYDLLLLIGILFSVSACAVALNRGEAVSHPLYYIALLVAAFIFYGWFWTHGGQTLGMRTWKIKVVTENGQPLTWKQSLIRFLAAIPALLPAGLGLFWMLFNSERLALHDRWSATRLISLKISRKPQGANNEHL